MNRFISTVLVLVAVPAFAGWQQDLAIEVKAINESNPGAVRSLDELRGLDPTFYLGQRRPEPEVARELKQLLAKGFPVALMMERVQIALATPARDVEERAQLVDGLLRVIATSGHRLADELLIDVATSADARHRGVALEHLGWTRTDEARAFLSTIALDVTASAGDRSLAIVGLTNAEAGEVINALAAQPIKHPAEVRHALANGLAVTGSGAASANLLLSALSVETDTNIIAALGQALARLGYARTAELARGKQFADPAARKAVDRAARVIDRRAARRR